MRGLDRGVDQGFALGAQLLREFDDQDRVLSGEPDDGEEPDGEIDVVRYAAQRHRGDGTQHPERDHQEHRERDGPALVERGQQQEHHERREREQQRRLRARELLLQRLPGPFEAEAARQGPGDALHLGDRVAAGIARFCRAADPHRRIVVVAHHLARADRPFGGGKRRERHHVASAVAHAEGQHVLGLHAAAIVGLHDHALHAPAIRKVVDVGRSEIGRDGVVDVLEGDTQRRRLLAVDDELDLLRRRQPFDIDVLQHRALGSGREQEVLGAHQLRVAALRPVLQAEAESARVPEVVDRRRLQRRDARVGDAREGLVGVGHDRLGGIVGPALGPVLERHERLRRVLALAEEAEPGEEGHVVDALALSQELLDVLDRVERAVERRFRRRLHVDGDEALVVDRQEAGGQSHESPAERADQHQIDQHQPSGARERPAHEAAVAGLGLLHAPVEPAERPAPDVVMAGRDWLEQGRAQRGRQRQRHQRGEGDGRDHGDRELAVDDADRAREERHRHEHRDQHQRNAYDCAGDLSHRLARGFARRQPFLGHDALDVLDHDDGVVDQDADGEHHGEQGQHVDGEAEHQQRHACAEQRHRHHDGRDDGVADVLQEQQHHQEHQHDRLYQGRDDFLDRSLDHRSDVIGGVVLDVGGEEL